MMKRIFAALFTVIMLMGLMTVTASAAADEASVGGTSFATLEDAAAVATAGDTIKLLTDVTLESALTLPADITLDGNGKNISGTIYAGGNLTFVGETKVTAFSASYYDRVITIGRGASLEITGTSRMTVAYGNTFNIIGDISNAKTADKASIKPSLKVSAGMSVTGSNDAAFNVTNAYVVLGSTTSKPGEANGTFTFNFTNSIVDATKNFCFYESTGGKAPTYNMTIRDSIMNIATNLVYSNVGCNTIVDNSNITIGSAMRNSGDMTIKNGADVTVQSMIQFGENAGNDGIITVDNATLDINCDSAGHAIDGKGTGKIVASNGANVDVGYIVDSEVKLESDAELTVDGTIKNTDITTDVTSTITAVDIIGESSVTIDASNAPIRGEINVLNLTAKDSTGNPPQFSTTDVTIFGGGDYADMTTDENGNIIFVDNTPLMIVGEEKKGFNNLQEAIDYITAGHKTTIKLLGDITLDTASAAWGTSRASVAGVQFPKGTIAEIDLNGFTITGTAGNQPLKGYHYWVILNAGDLTITDTSEGKTGMITNAQTGTVTEYAMSNTIGNYGKLTLNAGTIHNQKSGNGYSNYVIDNCSGDITNGGGQNAVFVMNGGAVISGSGNCEDDDYVAIYTSDYWANNSNSVTVTGGTVSGKYGIYIGTVGGGTATVNISGGEINGGVGGALTVKASDKMEVSVSGGTFNGDVAAADGVPAFITGGTFSNDVTPYCAGGFNVFPMAPGEYAVAKVQKVAVTFVGYHSVDVQAGTILPVFIPDNDGRELVGWYTEPEFVNKVDFSRPIIADTTMYPCWKKDHHDIDTGYVMVLLQMLKKLDISVEVIESEGGKIVVVEPEKVKYNKPAFCTVIADEGYVISDVIIDGESVGAVKEYTIEKLKGKHTVSAVFVKADSVDSDGQ